MKKTSNIIKKDKPPVEVKYGLNWGFSNYLKGKVEWKSFDDIKINWMYLKLFITSYKEKNLKKSLFYYKKLPKEYTIFASKTYPKIHKGIQKHILYRIMKNKGDMIKFLKFGIRNYSILFGENEKKFLYHIYTYIQKCKIQFNEGKLKDRDREIIDEMIDIFGETKKFNSSSNNDMWEIIRFDYNFLEIPMNIPKIKEEKKCKE